MYLHSDRTYTDVNCFCDRKTGLVRYEVLPKKSLSFDAPGPNIRLGPVVARVRTEVSNSLTEAFQKTQENFIYEINNKPAPQLLY